MVKNLNELAREIIKTNQYLTIASSDKKGSPWASAVVYSYDKDWNLYFLSIPSSNHCQNIKNREKVVVAIFDSHQLFGQGVGLQIEGEAVEVNTRDTGGVGHHIVPKTTSNNLQAKRVFTGVTRSSPKGFG